MSLAKRVVFPSALLIFSLVISPVYAANSHSDRFHKFEQLRRNLPALHQEFELEQHYKTLRRMGIRRGQLVIDLSPSGWHEHRTLGEDMVRLFDGKDVLEFESGGSEYLREKPEKDPEATLPEPYGIQIDWDKAKELEAGPCGLSGKDHPCIVVDAPFKRWARMGSGASSGKIMRSIDNAARIVIDTETGVWLRCQTSQVVEGANSTYRMDLNYTIKNLSYPAQPDLALFQLPEGLHEVKTLSPWNGARIRKELRGKPAPDLELLDIDGKPVSLAALKGRTVLLDFWTTWCPPCQWDSPSIEKLSQKYGGKDLAIISISVGEERAVVEKFLKKHPRTYPVILSSENEMPRPYDINVLPTYLIISPDGTLATAEQGEKGFAKLRSELQKAGLSTD